MQFLASFCTLMLAVFLASVQLAVCDDKPLEGLFLTKLIEAGNISEAQNAARVHWNRDSLDDIPTYTGYLTVNETTNSNLFFWFIPAIDEDPEEAPVMLWLNGALDTSSNFGLFIENGPFSVKKRGRIPKLVIRSRKATWARQHSMLYIDSVGTGFSYTDSKDGYAKNAVEVAEDLLKGLQQFYKLFPDYQSQSLYIAGESYAGKYAPILANKILGANALKIANNTIINVAGLALGGPLTDPAAVYTSYADYFRMLGLVSNQGQSEIKEIESRISKLVSEEKFDDAFTAHEELTEYFRNLTGYKSMANAFESRPSRKVAYYAQYLNTTGVRRITHVGKQPLYNTSDEAIAAIRSDLFRSYKSDLEQVISAGIKVLIYVGQYDLRAPQIAVSAFVDSLDTPLKADFQKATQKIVRDKKKGDVLGYAKAAGNFTFVIVRNAGHHVPKDQSRWSRDMIERFVKGAY